MEGQLERIVGTLYDAALEPELWAGLGPQLCGAFDATSFLLVVQRLADRQVEMLETDWPASMLADYTAHFYKVDCWIDEGLRQPAMTPQIGDEYFPDRDFIKQEVYCDFARPAGIRHLLGEWAHLESGSLCSLGLHHSAQRGAFTAVQAHQLATIFPHVLRSVRLREALQTARLRGAICETALDALAMGIVIVRTNGCVFLANRAAEAMAARQDGFTLQSARVDRAAGAARPEDTQRLRSLIVTATAHPKRQNAGGSLRLASISGGRGLAVTVTPLPRAMRGLHADIAPLALLLISDLDAQPAPLAQQLAAVFGLTPAEARLVAALAHGKTRADYAEEVGISLNTVKTQLSRAFASLEVNRESDLIRLALSLPQP